MLTNAVDPDLTAQLLLFGWAVQHLDSISLPFSDT